VNARGFLRNYQRVILKGAVKTPLPTPLRSSPNIVATFLMILATTPLQSALMYQFCKPVRYKPRLTRLPDSFHPSGFSPIVGKKSRSTNEALDV
jgi:hypothetical protein